MALLLDMVQNVALAFRFIMMLVFCIAAVVTSLKRPGTYEVREPGMLPLGMLVGVNMSMRRGIGLRVSQSGVSDCQNSVKLDMHCNYLDSQRQKGSEKPVSYSRFRRLAAWGWESMTQSHSNLRLCFIIRDEISTYKAQAH